MSNFNKLSLAEKNKIVDDYLSGDSMNILIDRYHHKFKVIKQVLDEANINHSYHGNPKMSRKKEVTQEEKNIVYDLYVNHNKGQLACAHAIGRSDIRIVRNILKEFGVKIRDFNEAASTSNVKRRKYPVNDSFFSHQNSRMAYVLGMLASDGTVSKDSNEIKLGLSFVDHDYLVMLNELLNNTRPIKDYETSNGFKCSQLVVCSQQIKNDLALYNIVPQKTFVFTFPTNLHQDYWIDFIRGYFDGDGSVSTSGKDAIKWQVCSATSDVLEHIVDFFYTKYNIPKVRVYKDKNKQLYNICYSTNATKQIYNILYTNDCIYLPRKKRHYEEVLATKTQN